MPAQPMWMRNSRYCRCGITWSETLLAAAGIGLVLAVVALGMEGVRTELKRHQAVAMMETLDRALLAYYQSAAAWPIDSGPVLADPLARVEAQPLQTDRFVPDPAAVDRMIQLMADEPVSRAILESLPQVLRVPPIKPADTPSHPWGSVQDPWGRRLQCLTAASPLATHRKAVAANRNRPIFISPGPDGRFGFNDVSSASDNIRSDENTR